MSECQHLKQGLSITSSRSRPVRRPLQILSSLSTVPFTDFSEEGEGDGEYEYGDEDAPNYTTEQEDT